jgi:hypothetical protein
MKSIETFLSVFYFRGNSTFAISRPSNTRPEQVELFSEVSLAADRAWRMSPVFAKTKYFSGQPLVDSPKCDPAMLGAKLAVKTGSESGLVILEVDSDIATSVPDLCRHQFQWMDTLNFSNQHSQSFVFAHPGPQIRVIDPQIAGVKIHDGDFVVFPPTDRMEFEDPFAPVFEIPWS